ncbi:MAG: hypothetical protein J0G96_01755 [Flavobacteriia bacterium]|nr:hypothetical protein [Flavobacteriia bacterium]OJX39748.1 MAG: hypothetical protein BGO87_01985 [Flavobacteriia bacterium 40-80]
MKKNLPNLIGSIVFCCAISSVSLSQKEHTLVSNQLLQISYSDGSCEIEPGKLPYQYAFLKIKNLTNSELTIGCNIAVQYEEGCNGCNGSDESRYYLKLNPNQLYTATCESDDRSLIFIRNPNFSGAWNFKEIRIENLDIK